MSRLTNLDHIQALVQDLQSSRDEVIVENEKLAREVLRLTGRRDDMEYQHASEVKELKAELCKLNCKIENYKDLCFSENQAKEHLQNFVQKANCELEELAKTLQAKEKDAVTMKRDFESFMEQVCDENKRLKQALDCQEKELCNLRSIMQNADEQKTYIVDLESETAEFIKKIRVLQESNAKYEDSNTELKAEIKSLERKMMKVCESRNFTSEALDALTEKYEKLKEDLAQVRKELAKAEEFKKESMKEIDKFDKLTGTMEEQLGKYRRDIVKLEENLAKEREQKKEMVEDFKQMELMAEALAEEQRERKAVEGDLTVARHEYKICEKRLRCAIQELESITSVFNSYKRNIQDLKSHPSRSCPPKCRCETEDYTETDSCCPLSQGNVNSISCQMVLKNIRRLVSLPSIQTRGMMMPSTNTNRSGRLMSEWRWPSICRTKERKRCLKKFSSLHK